MEIDKTSLNPKVFISYSWSTQEHQELVRVWADRLLHDGVKVVLDQYDLEPGNDAYRFMERMVTDPSVSHVLVVCDQSYADKANDRRAGVGVESQIISSEIYEQVDQSKFIPLVTGFDSSSKAILPVFMKSLVWIDFSSDEKVNESWESLIRLLYNRPRLSKPKLGSIPTYLAEDVNENSSVMCTRFEAFRTAVIARNSDMAYRRLELIDTCLDFADQLRIREPLNDQDIGTRIVNDCRQLVFSRDCLIDWLSLDL